MEQRLLDEIEQYDSFAPLNEPANVVVCSQAYWKNFCKYTNSGIERPCIGNCRFAIAVGETDPNFCKVGRVEV